MSKLASKIFKSLPNLGQIKKTAIELKDAALNKINHKEKDKRPVILAQRKNLTKFDI